jgi:hypothetical protein
VTLPTTPQTREGVPPRRARILLGATAKVGKTQTLSEWAPATTLIVDTHNGTRFLDGQHFVAHVHDWQSFVAVVDDVCRGGHRFHTIGLDLVNDLWSFADLRFGTGSGKDRIPASAADDYSRSRKRAQAAFEATTARLLAAPVGVWFLTHLREKTDKTGELVRYVPDMDKSIYSFIAGRADYVWLAEVNDQGQRVVYTQPNKHFEAGSRGSRDTPLPSPLPLDARALALALDRSLNPQDYDERGERKQPEPEPGVVEPAPDAPEDAPAPEPTPRDVKRTGESDVTPMDPWAESMKDRVAPFRGVLRDAFRDLGIPVPANVSSWGRFLGSLDSAERTAFTEWLTAAEERKAGVAWAEDPSPDVERERVDELAMEFDAEDVAA